MVAILAAATATAWCQYAAVGIFRTFFGLFQLEVGTARPALPVGGRISPAARRAWCDPAVPVPRLAAPIHLRGARRNARGDRRLLRPGGIRAHPLGGVDAGLGRDRDSGRSSCLAAGPSSSWRWTWRLALAGNLLTLVAVLIGGRSRSSAESSALAALPPARSGAPNVLLLVMDTERAQSMSLYGEHHDTTPHQAAWAQRQGGRLRRGLQHGAVDAPVARVDVHRSIRQPDRR